MLATDETPIILTAEHKAMIDAYKALDTFVNGPNWSYLAANEYQVLQPDIDEARAVMERIEKALPVHVLLTILPAYTKVRYKIDGRDGAGQTREGAWGLHYDSRSAVYPRRITTTMGFELWIGPDTLVTDFEITERG